MNRRLHVGGAFGHLLLVVVLAFGVFAMHTMGHPEHSSGVNTNGALHAVGEAHQGGANHGTVAPRTSTESAAMADHAAVSSAAPAVDGPMINMDVMSVCVAVLTGWLLWLFLGAAARRRGQLTALLARAMATLGPLPSPPGPTLVQLSVLRI